MFICETVLRTGDDFSFEVSAASVERAVASAVPERFSREVIYRVSQGESGRERARAREGPTESISRPRKGRESPTSESPRARGTPPPLHFEDSTSIVYVYVRVYDGRWSQ